MKKITAIVLVMFGVLCFVSCSDQETKLSETKKQEILDVEQESYPYEFIKTKIENFGDGNRMDLYAYSGKLDIQNLKSFCANQKSKIDSGKFYYIVIFDSKSNAGFPESPFTASYGMEETPQKHIRAIYEYNKLNGFSELSYYDTNKWQGVAKIEKI